MAYYRDSDGNTFYYNGREWIQMDENSKGYSNFEDFIFQHRSRQTGKTDAYNEYLRKRKEEMEKTPIRPNIDIHAPTQRKPLSSTLGEVIDFEET